jgi:hypothetical protein
VFVEGRLPVLTEVSNEWVSVLYTPTMAASRGANTTRFPTAAAPTYKFLSSAAKLPVVADSSKVKPAGGGGGYDWSRREGIFLDSNGINLVGQ